MEDLGQAAYLLGIEIHTSNTHIQLSQKQFAKKIIEKFQLQDSKIYPTPSPTTDDVSNLENKKQILHNTEQTTYRAIIGSLLYLTNETRPEISFTIQKLSQFVNKAT